MGSTNARLLLIGLDNAGKSTILSRIIDPTMTDKGITPTIGFKKDKFFRNGIDFQVLDMSGQSKYRDLWQSNAIGTGSDNEIHGIIFVVDSSDKMRIRVAKSELDMIIENKMISQNLPLLIYANKCDLKGACSYNQVEQMLQLASLKRNKIMVSCSGTTGKGVQEGIQWLTSTVKQMIQNKS